MSIQQLSVFLENQPGKLFEMTAVLAENKIDIRALSLAETTDFGIARLIVDDAAKAASVLRSGDFIASGTDVLAFAVPNTPGGLHNLLAKFNAAQVNIEYMYAFLGNEDKKNAYMIFRVTDTPAAEAALTALGLKPLSEQEIRTI